MFSNSSFISKTNMKKVNRALKAAGYSEYPGDRTTAQPNGGGSGYMSNLLNYMAAGRPGEQRQILSIINNAF